MLKVIKSKKGAVLLIATLVVAGLATVGAYAYFKSNGSGQGDATAGSVSTSGVAITLHASGFGSIVPGDDGQTVHFTADNASLTTSGYVGTISLDSTAVTSTDSGCQAYLDNNVADFSMDPVDENTAIPKNSTATALPNTGTLLWADNLDVDQTPCAGAPLTLHVTSN
jgi:hypothetical protein